MTTATTPAAEKREKMLRKVRGLLAQAEDPSIGTAEAQAFSEAAERLMVRYAIDEAMLGAGNPARRGTPERRTVPVVAPYAIPKAQLLAAIAGTWGVTVIRHRSRTGDVEFYMVGFPSDLDAIEMLYTSLLVQGVHGCTTGSRAYRSSWWLGFAQRVGVRVAEMRKAAVDDTPGSALVLADRQHEVDAALRASTKGRVRNHTSRPRDRSGLVAGARAGDTADLGNRGRVTGAARAALGA